MDLVSGVTPSGRVFGGALGKGRRCGEALRACSRLILKIPVAVSCHQMLYRREQLRGQGSTAGTKHLLRVLHFLVMPAGAVQVQAYSYRTSAFAATALTSASSTSISSRPTARVAFGQGSPRCL